MPKIILMLVFIFLAFSCKTSPNADKQYTDSREDRIYRLRLNPPAGSSYKYDIQNETEVKMEVGDKKMDNTSKTTVVVHYLINKDSAGNFLFNINYNKIHLYTKAGDSEADEDADNASNSLDGIERSLGLLKNAPLEATVSRTGEVISVRGYKELGAKLISGIADADANTRAVTQAKWDKIIGDGVIKKNMKDLFAFFPDSAVRVGDKWKIASKQKSEISFDILTTYRLKEIDDGVAVLIVDADMTSEPGTTDYLGTEVTSDLKGSQEGEYRIDIKTGMLQRGEIKSKVSGQLQAMGKEIPIKIATKISINNAN
jgi:Family of unknown function (DUF6263)